MANDTILRCQINCYGPLADEHYHQKVVDGAKRTAELATATASSALSKRTDGGADGSGRGRFKSGKDSLEQLLGIEKAQEVVRKGKLDKLIDDIEKNSRRLINDLDVIKTLQDAIDQFGEPDTKLDEGKKDDKKEPKKQ